MRVMTRTVQKNVDTDPALETVTETYTYQDVNGDGQLSTGEAGTYRRDVFEPGSAQAAAAQLGMFTDGVPATGPTSAEEYGAMAELRLAGITDPRERNRAITAAYGELFVSDPTAFQWAGMAMWVSEQVGTGMEHTGWAGDTRAALIAGNNAVYSDIYPAFMAYQDGGVAAVEAAGFPPEIVAGFRQIASGDAVGGNTALLRYEQGVVLQDAVYDQERFGTELDVLSLFMFANFTNDLSGVNLLQNEPFSAEPGFFNNIRDFDTRWGFIERTLLPAWQHQLATNMGGQISAALEAATGEGPGFGHVGGSAESGLAAAAFYDEHTELFASVHRRQGFVWLAQEYFGTESPTVAQLDQLADTLASLEGGDAGAAIDLLVMDQLGVYSRTGMLEFFQRRYGDRLPRNA